MLSLILIKLQCMKMQILCRNIIISMHTYESPNQNKQKRTFRFYGLQFIVIFSIQHLYTLAEPKQHYCTSNHTTVQFIPYRPGGRPVTESYDPAGRRRPARCVTPPAGRPKMTCIRPPGPKMGVTSPFGGGRSRCDRVTASVQRRGRHPCDV